MNDWALPGGFVRPGETVEQTAYRELQQETGISEATLSQLQVFSDPKRDPRGWIVSCAFTGCVKEQRVPQFGEDALDARWFSLRIELASSVACKNLSTKAVQLILTDGTRELSAIAQIERTDKQMISRTLKSEGLAFDHAEILLTACTNMFPDLI